MKKLILKIIYRILRDSAKRVIGRNNPKIIAITGTVGKTSAKEAICATLREKYVDDVFATAGNLNTEIGVPLTVLGYKNQPSAIAWPFVLLVMWVRSFYIKCPKYLILELAVDRPGDMDYFGGFINPDIGVITAITPVHMANFKGIEELRLEKRKLFSMLKKNGTIIYNIDDKNIGSFKSENVCGYSVLKSVDIYATNLLINRNGNNYTLNLGKRAHEIKSKLIGTQMVSSQLAGASVGWKLGIEDNLIVKALKEQKPLPGRMNLIEGKDEITIIDDTYNASPASVKAALDVLANIKSFGRRVAILGNMNELGSIEKDAHREAAKYARGKVDFAIFVGQNAKVMFEEFNDTKPSIAFNSRIEAESALEKLLLNNDLVLIKASQNGNYFEEIVKKLMKNPKESDKILVRQSKYWLHKKNIH